MFYSFEAVACYGGTRGWDGAAANGVSDGAAESRNGSCATRPPTARIYSRTIAGIKLAGHSGSRRS